MRRLPVSFLFAAILVAVSAIPAHAETNPPTLVDVQFSSTAVTVSGINYARVRVTANLTDASGVQEVSDMSSLFSYPYLQFQRVGSSKRIEGLQLSLASGNAQDGMWSADWLVPSTFDGSWQISRVQAYDTQFNFLDVDPRTQGKTRTLIVTGTHRPSITMGFSPQPVSSTQLLTVKGRAYYTDTGAGIASYKILVGRDSSCAEGYGDVSTFTNSNGYYAYTFKPIAPYGHQMVHCVFLLNPPQNAFGSARQNSARIAAHGKVPLQPVQKYSMSVSLSDATITLGHSTAFTGSVAPPRAGGDIYVQRYIGGSWNTILRGRVRTSSRYTLTIQPAARGTFIYRVWLLGDQSSIGTVSKSFKVTVS
jgi:hypothetical protein